MLQRRVKQLMKEGKGGEEGHQQKGEEGRQFLSVFVSSKKNKVSVFFSNSTHICLDSRGQRFTIRAENATTHSFIQKKSRCE